MTETARNFTLGVTSIVAALGLVGLLMLFGELDGLIKPRYGFAINTTDAAGLRSGSPVELNGVPIGVVSAIAMTGDDDFPVQIRALIDEGIRLATDIVPFATSSPLGGSATLQLERPRVHAATDDWLTTDGDAQISATIRSRLVEEVRNALDNFISPLVELAGNLNRYLETPNPADHEAVAASFRTTVIRINRSLAEIKTLVASLNEVFGHPDPNDPEAIRTSVRTAIANANTALESYSDLAQTLEAVAAEAVPAMTSLEAALNEVQLLANLARTGEGTVGQLMTNPDLYHSLQDTTDTLDQLLIEIRLMIQKIKAEGVKVGL